MEGFSSQVPFLLLMLVIFVFFYHFTPTKKTEKRKNIHEQSQKRESCDHQKWDSW